MLLNVSLQDTTGGLVGDVGSFTNPTACLLEDVHAKDCIYFYTSCSFRLIIRSLLSIVVTPAHEPFKVILKLDLQSGHMNRIHALWWSFLDFFELYLDLAYLGRICVDKLDNCLHDFVATAWLLVTLCLLDVVLNIVATERARVLLVVVYEIRDVFLFVALSTL